MSDYPVSEPFAARELDYLISLTERPDLDFMKPTINRDRQGERE